MRGVPGKSPGASPLVGLFQSRSELSGRRQGAALTEEAKSIPLLDARSRVPMTIIKPTFFSNSIFGALVVLLAATGTSAINSNAHPALSGFGQDSKDSAPQQETSTGEDGSSEEGQDKIIDEFGTFEIAVEDVPLPQVLNMLAIQSRRNIITSKRVGSVSITANLFDVTFYEALESILHIASLCYEEHGNFIYVMTCEEKVQRERANRVLEDRVYYLDHISPVDAEALVKPLLSDQGSMSKLGDVESGFAPGTTEAGGDSWAHEPVLVVRDYEKNLEAIQTLLADVDTPPTQVMVESTILITQANGDYAWGMDVSVLLKADFTKLLNPLNPVSYLQNLQQQPSTGVTGTEALTPSNNAIGLQSTVGATTESGGFKFGVLNENVAVFMRLLDEVSDTTILARPKILALNRQRAQVLVGERVAYLSTTQTETATTQSVQFLDTGINLILRPFISRDGSIRMELYPSVSEYQIRKIGDPLSPGYTEIPNETTHQITTNVRVRDGETLVLGGLFRDKATINRRSVPGLGDVPLVGNAFKGQDDSVLRQEIIFLVTPTILREELMKVASDEADDLVSNVLVGVREGLLPWARETVAANYNHDAYAAAEDGQVDLAISHINRSLRNNPNQPEMIRMRGELMGARSAHSNDGDVLRRIFDRTFRNEDGFGQGNQDDKVIEPISDPLSGRIEEQSTTFAAEKSDTAHEVFNEPETKAAIEALEDQGSASDRDTAIAMEESSGTDALSDSEFEKTPAAENSVADEASVVAANVNDVDGATDESPSFNMFTSKFFHTRLINWWVTQSNIDTNENANESVVSADTE